MDYKDIIRNMNNGEFKNVYLFYGREFYLLENVIKTCRKSLNESMVDFNMDILDGKELTLDQVISNAETLPFMDDKKIIIIKDFELLKGKKKNFTDTDESEFIDYLDKTPNSTVLIFIVYGDVDKRKSLVKKISKVGVVNHCDKLNDMDLFKWVKNKFKKTEIGITDSEIAYFIDQEGYRDKNSEKTLSDLENEISKISSFVGKGNLVTKEIIDKLSPKKLENDIFKLIDEIGNKNSSHAMKIVTDMILEGESVLGIFAMVSKQFKLVIQARQFQIQGYSSKVIAEKVGAHPFVVTKALKQGRQFNDDVIVDMLNFILESDYKIKNGLIKDNLAVEILVSKYCQ
ncbi:MAG: DNA polymerase III subunit delta [Paraclostridium sp.]